MKIPLCVVWWITSGATWVEEGYDKTANRGRKRSDSRPALDASEEGEWTAEETSGQALSRRDGRRPDQ